MPKKSDESVCVINIDDFLQSLNLAIEESNSLEKISSESSIESTNFVKTSKRDKELYQLDMPIHIANLQIKRTNKTISRKGQTCNKSTSRGNGKLFNVTGKEISLQLVETKWENGDHDISMMKVERGPIALKRLEHGLRIGIHKKQDGLLYMELRQARVDLSSENQWSQDYKANQDELDEGAGVDVFDHLFRAGATVVGPKKELIGTDNNTKNILCALFPQESEIFPVVAYVLTRVLPLINLYTN